MVRVMIVDDHMLLRRIVREVVEKESDLEIVAEASNGIEAASQATKTQPDVVLMDLDMPEGNGFEATERVIAASPHSRVVILTASHHLEDALHALQRGATGYMTKDVEPQALVHAIRCASLDALCMPRVLAGKVLAHLKASSPPSLCIPPITRESVKLSLPASPPIVFKIPPRPTPPEEIADNKPRPLTEREQEILNLMRRGLKNREIAAQLAIAESTVHKHIQNIFEKLHARNRTEAIYLTSIPEAAAV